MTAPVAGVGIDVGTAFSSIAISRGDAIEVIPTNEQGHRILPSIVTFNDVGEEVVGDAAGMRKNVKNTIFDTMALLGCRFSDESVQAHIKLLPFKVVAGKRDKPMIMIGQQGKEMPFPPEAFMTAVLRKLRQTAEAHLSQSISSIPVVLTVPACFDSVRRGAVRAAAQHAGLHNVASLIAAPTAAALQFTKSLYSPGRDPSAESGGSGHTADHNVMVIDIGAGSTDVSMLTIDRSQKDAMYERAVASNLSLGGRSFDNCLIGFCIEDFRQKSGIGITSDYRAISRLRTQCERAKRRLSQSSTSEINVEALCCNIDYSLSVTRTFFESLCESVVLEILQPIQRCLQDSCIDKQHVHDVVAVGGSTRIPRIQEVLREFFGDREVSIANDPRHDCLAACGSAAVAAALCTGTMGSPIKPVLPVSLGIEIAHGWMHHIVKRSTLLPSTSSASFTFHQATKPTVLIALYEGEHSAIKHNTYLCTLCLDDIPCAQGTTQEIVVTIDLETNGEKNCIVHESYSGVQVQARITEDVVICLQGRVLTKSKEIVARRQTEPALTMRDDPELSSRSQNAESRPHSHAELRNQLINQGPLPQAPTMSDSGTFLVPASAQHPIGSTSTEKQPESAKSLASGDLGINAASRVSSPVGVMIIPEGSDEITSTTSAHDFLAGDPSNDGAVCDQPAGERAEVSNAESSSLRYEEVFDDLDVTRPAIKPLQLAADPPQLGVLSKPEFNSSPVGRLSGPRVPTDCTDDLDVTREHVGNLAMHEERPARPSQLQLENNMQDATVALETEQALMARLQAENTKMERHLRCLQGEEKIMSQLSVDELEKLEQECVSALSRIQACRKKRREKEDEERRERSDCVVCMSRNKNTVFIPCGHMVCCSECAGPLTQCPTCRGEILQKVRTFT